MCKGVRKLLQASQIVHRQKLVDVWQHCPNAGRSCLETGIAQQRVEPNQSTAGFMEPLHFLCEAFANVAIEPVADQKHDRALGEESPRPAPVEFRQTRADASASGPVGNGDADTSDGDIDVALLQVTSDVGKP